MITDNDYLMWLNSLPDSARRGLQASFEARRNKDLDFKSWVRLHYEDSIRKFAGKETL